jgi:hypothetical protein
VEGKTKKMLVKRLAIGCGIVVGVLIVIGVLVAVFGQDTEAPSVETKNATEVSSSQATLNGDLTDLGEASSSTVSFEWGTSADSYSDETDAQERTRTGAFDFGVSGLKSNTTYYFRAKAIGASTAYGAQKRLVTLPSLNDEVTVGKAIWQLLEVKDRGSVLLASESEYPPFAEDKTTTGKFIEITLQVTNIGTITEDWWGDPMLVDQKGTEFKNAYDVYLWIPDDNEAVLPESLQPRIPRQFTWIFEVPNDALGLKVRLDDIAFWSNKEALIDLAL